MYDGEACTGKKATEQWPGTPYVGSSSPSLEKEAKSIMCQFWNVKAMETYTEWKAQGYDFNKYVERGGKCVGTDRCC